MSGGIVSVVIPHYDPRGERMAWLDRLVQQLRQEEMPASWSLEVTVVEGVSPPAAARNEGSRRSRGELLAFVDDDVSLDGGAVRALLEALLAHGDAVAACSRVLLPSGAGWFQRAYAAQVPHAVVDLDVPVQEVPLVHTACCLVRRDVFEAVGMFDERLVRGEDSELSLRLRRRGGKLLLVRDAVCRHPCPAGPLEAAARAFRDGRGAGMVDASFPELNLDIAPGGIREEPRRRTVAYRALRLLGRIVSDAFTLRWISLVYRVFSAAGYVCGRLIAGRRDKGCG